MIRIHELNDEESYFLLCAIDRNILIDSKKSDMLYTDIDKLTGTFEPSIFKRCPYCIYYNPVDNQPEGRRLCFGCKCRNICKSFEIKQNTDRQKASQYMKYLRKRYGYILIQKLQENRQ